MNKPLLGSALRVLVSLHDGTSAIASDLDGVRSSALPEERDLDLAVWREMSRLVR